MYKCTGLYGDGLRGQDLRQCVSARPCNSLDGIELRRFLDPLFSVQMDLAGTSFPLEP